jgi:hypothetical protein
MCSVFFAIAEFLSIKIQLEKQNGFPEFDTRGCVDRFACLLARPLERGASQLLRIWHLLIITDYSVTGDGDSNVCDPIRQGPLWNVILAITVLNGYCRRDEKQIDNPVRPGWVSPEPVYGPLVN